MHRSARAALIALASLVLLALTAARARASDAVTLEAGGGQSKPTPTLPSTAFLYQKLGARASPTDAWTFSGGARLAHDFAAAPDPGHHVATGDDWIASASLGATWDATDHLSFALDLSGAAPSTRVVAAPFSYAARRALAYETEAATRATTWSAGGALDATYDTFDVDAPPRLLDASLDLSVAYTRFALAQSVSAIDGPDGARDVSAIGASCARARAPVCDAIAVAAQTSTAALQQLRLGATLSLTIAEDVDVAIDGAAYVYDNAAPDTVGLVDARAGGLAIAYGAGLPLLPPRWSLRPEAGVRAGALSLRAWVQRTAYTDATSSGDGLGGKAQITLGAYRLYASGSLRADQIEGTPAYTWTAALGLTRTF